MLISTAVEIEDSIDLTLIKQNHLSSPPPSLADLCIEHKTEINTEINSEQKPDLYTIPNPSIPTFAIRNTKDLLQLPVGSISEATESMTNIHMSQKCDQGTQTDIDISIDQNINEINLNIPLFQNIKVKEEPKNTSTDLKFEDGFPDNTDFYYSNAPSDNSEDDISLVNFQKKKRKRAKNGDVEVKRKRKPKLKDWEYLMRTLPEGTALTVVDKPGKVDVKQEVVGPHELLDLPKKVKSEPVEFNCCICFVQCYSRSEMLQHYKYV